MLIAKHVYSRFLILTLFIETCNKHFDPGTTRMQWKITDCIRLSTTGSTLVNLKDI